MCLKAAVATGAPGPTATSVPGHLEMVLLFADGPHSGHRVRLAGMLLHRLLPAEAEGQAAGRTWCPPAHHPPQGPWGPGAPGKKRAGRSRDILRNERPALTANSRVPNGRRPAGQAVLPMTQKTGDTDSTLAPGSAPVTELHEIPGDRACPRVDPDCGVRKDPTPWPRVRREPLAKLPAS